MAVTKTTYTQSGSTTQYAVPFEVIAAADIDVYLDGVLQLQQNTTSTADPTHPQVISGEISQGTSLTNYTVASNNATITFNAAPTTGAFIIVERTTDDTLLETFVSGSTVRAADLNSAFERVLFIAQEGVSIAEESLNPSETLDDAFDAKGSRVVNVGNATEEIQTGLKTIWVKKQKDIAANILLLTDWYVTRKSETGADIPDEVTTFRASTRAACEQRESEIRACTTTAELASLIREGGLTEWPTSS